MQKNWKKKRLSRYQWKWVLSSLFLVRDSHIANSKWAPSHHWSLKCSKWTKQFIIIIFSRNIFNKIRTYPIHDKYPSLHCNTLKYRKHSKANIVKICNSIIWSIPTVWANTLTTLICTRSIRIAGYCFFALIYNCAFIDFFCIKSRISILVFMSFKFRFEWSCTMQSTHLPGLESL